MLLLLLLLEVDHSTTLHPATKLGHSLSTFALAVLFVALLLSLLQAGFVLLESLPVGHLGAPLASHMYLAKLLLVIVDALADIHRLQHLLVLHFLPLALQHLLVVSVRVPLRVVPVEIGYQGGFEDEPQAASLLLPLWRVLVSLLLLVVLRGGW